MTLKKAILLLSMLFGLGAHAETTVITADRWFDSETGNVIGPARVVVTDGMIESVNPERVPADAALIELGDRTLVPGLIDMHTHLTGDYFTGDRWVTMPVYETAADWAVLGTKFARQTLEAGFTTVRDVGALPGFPDVALMKAIDRGTVPGPDMWPAGHYISITGGHCDITGFAPGIHELGPRQGIADGVAEVIKAVRYQAKHGVRVIKVCATAGVFSFSNNAAIGAQQYSQEELDVAVREATKLGLKVVAHAHGTDGINAAIRAGVASIDHGSVLADESIRKAYRAGVKMAFGTDAGVYRHGDNGREFAALVARDLPEAHVLKMATANAADLLGVDDRGVIATGKRADLIAVPGNPLEDISVMEDVRFVMKQGVIYKQE